MGTQRDGVRNGLHVAIPGLLIFLLGNGLLVNLALPQLHSQFQPSTTLDYTVATLNRIAIGDSWMPMRRGLEHMAGDRKEGLYEQVFFNEETKLQYPPQSLAILSVLRGLGIPLTDVSLNRISFVAVATTGIFVGLILTTGLLRLRESRGEHPPPPYQTAGLVGLGVVFTLTFYPVVRAYHLGQIQTWIDALIAAALWCFLIGRRATAGLLSGVACAIKPTLGLLLVWGLLRRRWRFVAGFGCALAAVTVVSLGLYGFSDHLGYLDVLSSIARHGESYYPNQSVNGLLHRAFFNGSNLRFDPGSFAPYHAVVHGLTLATGLALIAGALFWRAEEAKQAELPDLCLALASFTLASPIVWEHHYGVFLPIFAAILPFVLGRVGASRSRLLLFLGLSYCLVSNNFDLLNQLADSHWNFLQSYVLFAGLLLVAILYRLRHLTALAAPTPR